MTDDSTELYDTYSRIYQVTKNILSKNPSSYAYFDYTRAEGARNAFDQWEGKQEASISEDLCNKYFVKAMRPVSATQLTPEVWSKLQRIYGDAALRVALIDDNYHWWLEDKNTSHEVLSTGGACALETIDTKILSYLQSKPDSKTLVKKYILDMFQQFPTWTQITGALIPAKGLSVMYDETFPWHLRIADYGIENAELRTKEVYTSILSAVDRYAKLHHPDNQVVSIPFTDLNLIKGGQIQKWYEVSKCYLEAIEKKYSLSSLDYTPHSYLKYWLEYTYFGPEILSLTKEIIKNKYADLYDKYHIANASIHVRGKQIDHLDSERGNAWMHNVILDSVPSHTLRKVKRLLSGEYHRLGLASYAWLRDHYKEHRTFGFAGFLDFNYQGEISHELNTHILKNLKHFVEKTGKIDKEIHKCPLRLHSGNVDNVIKFLAHFKSPYSVSLSKEMLLNIEELKSKVSNMHRKQQVIKNITDTLCVLKDILSACHGNQKQIFYQNLDIKNFEKNTYILMKRILSETVLSNLTNGHDMRTTITIIFKRLIGEIDIDEKNRSISINFEVSKTEAALFQQIITIIEGILLQYRNHCQKLEQERQDHDHALSVIYKKISRNIMFSNKDSLTENVDILPLCNNVFVSYMQQLLFIPSVRAAYIDMSNIEASQSIDHEKKEEKIIAAIQQIYPVVCKCILYIMKGGEYPLKERFENTYSAIFKG